MKQLGNKFALRCAILYVIILASCSTPTEIDTEHMSRNLQFMVKDTEIGNFYEITDSAILMFANIEDKKRKIVECAIYADEITGFIRLARNLYGKEYVNWYKTKGIKRFASSYYDKFKPIEKIFYDKNSDKPLRKLRIAIDAGHIAGSVEEALMEQRIVQIANNETVFYESLLTFATASFLADTLQRAGAEVLLTRKEFGHTAFGSTYKSWLKSEFKTQIDKDLAESKIDSTKYIFLTEEADSAQIFHKYFKFLNIRKRAEVINDFSPHITVILHYNIDQPSEFSPDNKLKTTTRNYNMAFVPGSFMNGELQKPAQRAAFLRLLLSGDINSSVDFSDEVVRNYTKTLKVAPVSSDFRLSYLDKGSLFTGKAGVYARNLGLTRLIKGTICYGETFCQNHQDEYQRLADTSLIINDLKVPKRTKEVAMSYYQAIESYCKKMSQNEEQKNH